MTEQPPFPGSEPQPPTGQPQNPYGTPPPPPPPPPAGGYGAPMPPPPPSDLAPLHGNFSVGAAVGYGWRAFKNNVGPFLGMAVIIFVASALFGAISGSMDRTGLGANLIQVVGQVVAIVLSAALMKGALDVTAGRAVSIGTMFDGWDKVQIVVAAILVAIGTVVGIILLVIPGLIWMFLTWFTNFFVVDRGLSAIDGIKASISFAKGHVGDLLLLALASFGLMILGVLTCLVGIFVAMPVVLIAGAYAFRVLQGQEVAVQA